MMGYHLYHAAREEYEPNIRVDDMMVLSLPIAARYISMGSAIIHQFESHMIKHRYI